MITSGSGRPIKTNIYLLKYAFNGNITEAELEDIVSKNKEQQSLEDKIATAALAVIGTGSTGQLAVDINFKAEEMKRSAVEAENTYNKALADARAKANDIVNEAKVEMQKDLDKAIAKADLEIAAKAAESEKAISAIKDSAVQSVEEVANATANNIVDAILPEAADTKTIKAAVAARLKG